MNNDIIYTDSYDFFDRIESGLVLAFFYEHNDHQCRLMEQIIDELSDIYNDGLVILAADVEQSPGLAEHYQIESVPMVLIFKDGEVIEAVEGANLSDVYKDIIDELI